MEGRLRSFLDNLLNSTQAGEGERLSCMYAQELRAWRPPITSTACPEWDSTSPVGVCGMRSSRPCERLRRYRPERRRAGERARL